MNDDVGLQCLRTGFLAHCGSARPQLVILDSHHSHEVLDMFVLAQKEDVHVMGLPPHTTHALQPLDKVVLKSFKTAHKKTCTEFLASHPSLTINKATRPRLKTNLGLGDRGRLPQKGVWGYRDLSCEQKPRPGQCILGIGCWQEHVACCWCWSSGRRWHWRGSPINPWWSLAPRQNPKTSPKWK